MRSGIASTAPATATVSTAGRTDIQLARTVDDALLGECLTTFAMFGGPLADKAVSEEALAVTRRSGDRTNAAWSHNNLGLRALAADDLKTGRQHFGLARAILREIGDLTLEPVANLGWVHLRSGDPCAADSDFIQTLLGFEQLLTGSWQATRSLPWHAAPQRSATGNEPPAWSASPTTNSIAAVHRTGRPRSDSHATG
jgi:hypothetical protein